MAVLGAHQVRDITNISPSNERWTKRYQWENYAEVDKEIMPLDPIKSKQIQQLDDAGVELMNNLTAAEQQKAFDDGGTNGEGQEDSQIPQDLNTQMRDIL